MPLAPSTTSDPLRTPPPSGPDGSFSPSELVGCGPVQADDWPAVPLWFSCRNAAHTMDQRKGEPMLTGLTQFFNDAYLFGGDLLSVAINLAA
ncbi:MAG: hypothetical protein CME34_18640 [Gordonia sp.]|jgi:hypothetical protein|nr:hypothetical protein [Gordonia sp. (in: high G+C Gram-positive bacteria)]